LAGEVVAHQRAWLEGGQGSDVEDLPAATALHVRAQGVAQTGQCQHVELDQLLLATPVLLDEQPGAADAGVVHQQVDAPFALFQFLQQAGELQRLAQVADTQQRLDAEALAQFAGDAFQRLALARHQDQVMPAPRQCLCNGQAEAAGGAGDQRVALVHSWYSGRFSRACSACWARSRYCWYCGMAMAARMPAMMGNSSQPKASTLTAVLFGGGGGP